jgi:glycosyltransferase involved in cell wall biosynthesis
MVRNGNVLSSVTLQKKYLKLSEKIAVKYSDIVVADNKLIQDEIFCAYDVKSYLIEYGGDNVKKVKLSNNTASHYGIASDSYAFKVCRIVPENNIDLILDVFSKRSMNLVLVGNWAFSNYGLGLKEKYKGYDNLILLDPIYEQSAIDELRSNCSLYIHGHSAGGTNPSLVEAMNLGLCCVVYDASYNVETTENKALYFNTPADLNSFVEDYENNRLDVKSVKEALYDVALRRYSWSLITDKYAKVFMEATKS